MEKNKKMMAVIMTLLIILLIVIVGVSVFAFRLINKDSSGSALPDMTPNQGVSIENSEYIKFTSPLNVNLKEDGNGKYMLSIDIAVYIDASNAEDADLIAKLQDSEAVVRDVALTIFRDKTDKDMNDPDSVNVMKQELLRRLQEEFKTNLIYKVYIGEYFIVKLPN